MPLQQQGPCEVVLDTVDVEDVAGVDRFGGELGQRLECVL
jgi:hypothetical protein